MRLIRLTAAFALLLAGCAPLPHRSVQWRPSPNFDERRPDFVIIHATTNDTAEKALNTLTDPNRKVSAHYLIGRDGTLYQLVAESARAWHAGESYWGGLTDLNSASIGIELDNNGAEPFPEAQIAALLALLEDLRLRYRIPAANILAHGDVAPTRKTDPGPFFPWKTLAAHGLGLWCDEPDAPAPAGFAPLLALQAIGYDLTNRELAVRAFHLHYRGNDTAALADADYSLLNCLAEKKAQPNGGIRSP